MDYLALSASEIVRGFGRGDFTPREIFESCLSRINLLEPKLKTLLALSEEKGRNLASHWNDLRAGGEKLAPLAGVPVILADNFCLKGVLASCGSRMLEGWAPPYDSAVAEYFEGGGALFAGKGNMDEFGLGSSTEGSSHGPGANPWDDTKTPGGASGGAAAAVAAGYVPLAAASDLGGDLRQPAAYCGVYGLKPTWGLVSRWGLIATAPSLEQGGLLARTAEDLALGLSVVAVPDERDGTSRPGPRPDYLTPLGQSSLKGMKIAAVKDLGALVPVDPEMMAALEKVLAHCRDEGAEIVEISLPLSLKFGPHCHEIIACAEASSSLARYDGVRYGMSCREDTLEGLYFKTRGEGFGFEAKARIIAGTFALAAENFDRCYGAAQKTRALIKAELSKAFGLCDLIALPTTPGPAFGKGEASRDLAGMDHTKVFTLPANLAGIPALTLNGGFTGGENPLPLGIQFMAPQGGEADLLRTAFILEGRLGRASVAPMRGPSKGGDRQ